MSMINTSIETAAKLEMTLRTNEVKQPVILDIPASTKFQFGDIRQALSARFRKELDDTDVLNFMTEYMYLSLTK